MLKLKIRGDRPVLKRQAEPALAVIVPVSSWRTKVRVVAGVGRRGLERGC
jgi:hypothetical protein